MKADGGALSKDRKCWEMSQFPAQPTLYSTCDQPICHLDDTDVSCDFHRILIGTGVRPFGMSNPFEGKFNASLKKTLHEMFTGNAY